MNKRVIYYSTQALKKKEVIQDPRIETMRKLLFEPVNNQLDRTIISSPSQPPVTLQGLAESDAIEKDSIERAWFVLKKEEEISIKNLLHRQYSSMRAAMLQLEKHPKLFAGAMDYKVTQFPRYYKTPTQTPPLEIEPN